MNVTIVLTMNLQLDLVLVTQLLCVNLLFQLVESEPTLSDAVIECGKMHQIEPASLSHIEASFASGKCALKCAIGDVALPVDVINEGEHCPEDMAGICRAGQCIGGQSDALHQCGLKHKLDLNKTKVDPATRFTNDQCTLRCVLGGVELSVNHLHEGSPCPANSNGVCRAGACAQGSHGSQATNPASTINPLPSTAVTQASIDSSLFSPSKMKLHDVILESVGDSLTKQTQVINLYFQQTNQSSFRDICVFYLDSKPNFHDFQNIHDIPSKLNKDSQMMINLQDTANFLARKYVNLYSLFSTFYHNHKLTFGQKEQFFANFTLYRENSVPQEKLMDLVLDFEIVFSN